MSEKVAPRPLTLDEAIGIISQVARNGEGADQMRALKMVLSQETGTAAIAPPLSDPDVIERLSRLIRAAGPTASQLAYRKAFPRAIRPIHHASAKVTEADIPPIDVTTLPINLRGLYRMFPDIKQSGCPKGFPIKAGLAVKKKWVQDQAKKLIIDREQAKLDSIAIHAIPDEPTDD